MTQTFSSVEIEQHLQQEEADQAREIFTAGTFGESAEPWKLQSMSLRRHYLFEAETDLEHARELLERISEVELSDNISEVVEQVWKRLAEEDHTEQEGAA